MARKNNEVAVDAEQADLLEGMRGHLNDFVAGLGRTHELGIPVRDVFAYCGIEVPSYVAPLLERALAKGVARSHDLAENPA